MQPCCWTSPHSLKDEGNVLIKSDKIENGAVHFPDKDMGLSLVMDHGSAVTRSKMQRVLTPEWIRKYHGEHSSGNPQLNTLAPGIFKGEYGGHGVELIHVLDGQGVKITGDNNAQWGGIR